VAVKIRLRRTGAKGRPSYRVVVADERASRRGSIIEAIGTYDPLVEPSLFKVDKDKVNEWLKKGAQPTDTVRKLLGKAGVMKAIDFSSYKKRAPRKAEAVKEEKPAAAPAEAKPEEKK
jgi:small subunit ribosomal protein S16